MTTVAFGLWITILSLGGCTQSKPSSEGTLRASIDFEPNSMDWQRNFSRVLENIAEGLTEYDLRVDPPVLRPALAKSWRPRGNGRIWTFSLRDDVRWSDGQRFTGEDVLASWKRLLTPTAASRDAYHLFPVKNARAFYEGKVDFKEVGIRLKDPLTLEIELSKPLAFFPAVLSIPSLFPIRTDLVDHLGVNWSKPEFLVSLGPYRLAEWQRERKIVLKRNEFYYGEKPKVASVELSIVSSKQTQLTLFDAGMLDQVFNVPEQLAEPYRKTPAFHLVDQASVTYLGLVVSKPPFDSRLVRRALGRAIDRSGLARILRFEPRLIGDWVPPGVMGHDEGVGLKHDVVEAKTLLGKAGITTPPSIEIAGYGSGDEILVAEYLQAQLKKTLGWTVKISTQEFKFLRARLKDDPPHSFLHGWTADYLDPDTFFSILTSGSSDNHTHFKNAAYDRLIDQASQTLDSAERLKLYRRAAKKLIEDEAVVIPLYVAKQAILSGPRVKSYPYNSLEKMVFKFAELK